MSNLERLPAPTPSTYERQAIEDIRAWRIPGNTWWDRTGRKVRKTVHQATGQIRKIPGVEWTVNNVVGGLISVTNEITQDWVWRDAIYKEYRKAGHEEVHTADDVALLDLEDVDKALKGLETKYLSLAAVEGTATGFAGISGLLPDIVGLVTINLRAAGEYATYCGFDLSEESERLYAMEVLNQAAAEPASESADALSQSQKVAIRETQSVVRRLAVGGSIRAVARSIALRLTRQKIAQILPVAGAMMAGGFNAWYTHVVCDTAYHLYRERFLERKYGKF